MSDVLEVSDTVTPLRAMQKSDGIKLEPSWKAHLLPEFSKEYMQALRVFLQTEKKANKKIYPKGENTFKAFELTPFDQVKVVILGQDPYHQPGQAHGLSFSVPVGVPPPPSLKNIYKELETDVGLDSSQFSHGFLESWAKQGVLLLNAVLTVEDSKAGAHQGRGWEIFTDKVIEVLNREKSHVVFILWGSYAQKKGQFIDRQKHYVIESAHPSPLSSYRGFFGSRPFSKTNQYLKQHHMTEVNWELGAINP
jgi:uracil-DNA glycosylase